MADGPNHELIERLKVASEEADDMLIEDIVILFAEAALALIQADKERVGVLKALGVKESGADG